MPSGSDIKAALMIAVVFLAVIYVDNITGRKLSSIAA